MPLLASLGRTDILSHHPLVALCLLFSRSCSLFLCQLFLINLPKPHTPAARTTPVGWSCSWHLPTILSLMFLPYSAFFPPILSLTVSVSAGPCHPRGAGFLAQCLQCPVPKRPWPALIRPVPALRTSVQGFTLSRLSAGHATPPQL